MANILNIAKVTTLPATLAASTMYLVPNVMSGFLDIYVTDNTGATINRTVSKQDVATAGSVDQIFADYASLTAYAPTSIEIAYVKDASGDSTVTSGGALYIWDTSLATPAWTKMSESTLFWADIQNIPAAVSGLSVITVGTDNFLAFNGVIIPTVLAAEDW